MKFTSAGYLKTLGILHKAMIGGVVLISLMVVFIMNKASTTSNYNGSLHAVFMYIAPVLAFLGIVASTYLFKKKLDIILLQTSWTLAQKLNAYRSACILRWAVIESAMLFSTIALFLTGKYYYIIFLFILITFFIMYAPSKEQIISHLQLNSNEQLILEDEYAEIN